MHVSSLCSENIFSYCEQLKNLGPDDSIARDAQKRLIIIHGVENPQSEKELRKAANRLVQTFIDIYLSLPREEAKRCVEAERETLQRLEKFYESMPTVTNKLCTGREQLSKLDQATRGTWDKAIVPIYQKRMDGGFPKAQSNLGLMYYYGFCIAKDEEKALKLWRSAVEQGYAHAISHLALHYQQLYLQNRTDTESLSLLQHYIQKAAEVGLVQPAHSFAMALKYELRDEIKAFEFFKLAAEQNDKMALRELAQYYLNGIVVEKDEEKGLALLTAAAEQGFCSAHYELALHLRNRNDPKDNDKIVSHLERAIAQGFVPACSYLANCYARGDLGLEIDPQKAEELMRLVDSSHDSNSAHQYHLETLLKESTGSFYK